MVCVLGLAGPVLSVWTVMLQIWIEDFRISPLAALNGVPTSTHLSSGLPEISRCWPSVSKTLLPVETWNLEHLRLKLCSSRFPPCLRLAAKADAEGQPQLRPANMRVSNLGVWTKAVLPELGFGNRGYRWGERLSCAGMATCAGCLLCSGCMDRRLEKP